MSKYLFKSLTIMIKRNLHRTFVSRGILKSTTLRNHFVVQTTAKFGAKKPQNTIASWTEKMLKQWNKRLLDLSVMRKAYASFNQTFPKRLKIIIFLCNYKVVCMPRWWGKQNAGAKPSILWCQISPKYLITIF